MFVSRGFMTAAVVAAVTALVTLVLAPGRPAPRERRGPDMAVRPATAADVPAIARIWREGWADGHQGHVPDALAAERTPASFDGRTLERVGHTWVADNGGVVAGLVVVGAPPGWPWWPTRPRRRPARSRSPPTATSARSATDDNPLSPSLADRDQS